LREFLSNSDPTSVDELPFLLADPDGDGDADGSDMRAFAEAYGRQDCSELSPCPFDLNGDGQVDNIDLFLFTAAFGRVN